MYNQIVQAADAATKLNNAENASYFSLTDQVPLESLHFSINLTCHNTEANSTIHSISAEVFGMLPSQKLIKNGDYYYKVNLLQFGELSLWLQRLSNKL